MTHYPPCPSCHSEFTYQDGELFLCPDCQHEWNPNVASEEEGSVVVKDAHGNVLAAGDTVTVVKDLKIKGSSSSVKVGTKCKILRLQEGDHDLDCKVDGMGSLQLKSQFVKKT
jgi:protein PhnA